MKRVHPFPLVLFFSLSLSAPGCGSGMGGGSTYGSPVGGGGGGTPATCSGATPVALTVKNYLAWCSVSVAGGPPSAAASQTVCVADGPVTLAATALVGFQLGSAPWHDADGDTGTGTLGTTTGTGQAELSTTTRTVAGSAPACVWICCEFSIGGGCPATDQCP